MDWPECVARCVCFGCSAAAVCVVAFVVTVNWEPPRWWQGGLTMLTADELREIAERLVAMDDGARREHPALMAQVHPHSPMAGLFVLARAYLAEHPADDGEPITPDWLRSVGSREPHGVDYAEPPTLTIPGYRYGVLVMGESGGRWDWCRGARVLATVRTRGDVRRLCRALGIELANREGS